MVDPVGYLIDGLFAIGMAVSFFAADPRSPPTRALALFLALFGAAMLLNIAAFARVFGTSATFWVRIFSLVEIGVLCAAFEWILRVGRTEIGAETTRGDRLLRLSQALAGVYGVAGITFPGLRLEFWNVAWTLPHVGRPFFYLFAVPFGLALALAGARIIELLRARLDHAEWLRLIAVMLATPFWCGGIFLPPEWKPLGFALGAVIFLGAAIRYHVIQGERGQFLARFLSPQIVALVRERGLASLRQSRTELSVVVCDLRGFTVFTETAAPEEIMRLLEEYYAAVGEVVAGVGGSISNFAGDGILALVGAPIPCPDHAVRAMRTALEIRDRMGTVLSRWRKLGLDLGIGVGVASGFVTVGVIGGSEHLEYTAVGPAVNLAARLCGRAEAGQVLADARVAGLAGDTGRGYRLERIGNVELKGFARPVTIFAVA